MDANSPDIVPYDDPRWRLADHLDAIKLQQDVVAENAAQWRRLQLIIEAEARAQAKLDAIRAQDADELASQLVNPTGLHETANHDALGEADWELARAKREADVAKACMAAVSERSTVAVQRLEALKHETFPLAVAVMIEEVPALAAEIGAETERLKAKHARLWGLRDFIGEIDSLRRLLPDVPVPIHPDTIQPTRADIVCQSEAWRSYAGRLVADTAAEFDEE
ncbi:MAG: hypothetical protein WCA78_13995 [Rhizomicrobium sp.]